MKTVSALLSTGTVPLIPQLLTVEHSFGYTAFKIINEVCETTCTAGVKHFQVLAESGTKLLEKSFRTDWRSIRNWLDLTKPSYFS